MTPREFITKWTASTLKERSSSQEHFIDLCHLLGESTPAEADPDGAWYAFEKGASKAGGGDGWADVWKRGCFAWEYKGKGKDLQAAFKQLQLYTPALEYPPLLIVSDIDTIIIHTAFTGTVPEIHVLTLEDLADADKRRLLKWAFTEPEKLRPGKTTAEVTEEAASRFAMLAQKLRERGHEPHQVAHFLNRLLFCFFAEDVGLLPKNLFTRLLENAAKKPERFQKQVSSLFASMAEGGDFGIEIIEWFNGGLFGEDAQALPLEHEEIKLLVALGHQDWSTVEPSIIGTLFERGLDPAKRAQLGAHYTDPESIQRLIRPTILEPLQEEWEQVKNQIKKAFGKTKTGKSQKAIKIYQSFLTRLRNFRILDPACGSGNFLYLALRTLKDLEHKVILEAEALGFHREFPGVGPETVHGIEINAYAAELARVTIWIGDIQWMLEHGFNVSRNPILRSLDTIEERDAILNPDDTEPAWPKADVIIGNPPFLGDKKMISELGEEYVTRLRKRYKGRVPGGADLVTYWYEKAREHVEAGKAKYVGLVATNSIRQKRNRLILERIIDTTQIYEAWSDEPWVNDGADVRVSLICFGGRLRKSKLNDKFVEKIYSDLTAGHDLDLTLASPLPENNEWSYFGFCLAGKFKVPGELARKWLKLPNPHGQPNSDVLKPIYNGSDITRHWSENWVIDFGLMEENEAALYEAPFDYVVENVKPVRIKNRRKSRAERWWRFGEARPALRRKLNHLRRYIATPETAKHRFFVWFPVCVAPEHSLIVIPREDDEAYGMLQSRFHQCWAYNAGGRMGKGNDPRYNSSVTFKPFPFPEGLTPDLDPADYDNPAAEAIANAARRLVELRDNWLNPPEWVERVPEEAPGYPDRVIPKPGHEKDLKKRTLTNLYNERPAWLDNAHKALDEAVALAYGWKDYNPDMTEEDILKRLLTLNQERSS